MKKKIMIVMVVAVLISSLCPLLPVYADNYKAMDAPSQITQPPSMGNSLTNKVQNMVGSWVEKLLAAPIQGFIVVLQSIGLKDYDDLIFNQDIEKYAIPPYITRESWEVAEKWFNYFYFASYGLVFLAILFTGFKISFNAYNAKAREEAQKAFMRWLYAFLIMWGAPLFLNLMVDINNAGVTLCASAVGDSLNAISSGGSLGDGFITTVGEEIDNYLAQVLVQFGYLSLLVYFNIIYIVRDLVLLGLYAFTPILIWLWALSNNETAIKTWFGESMSVIFMQLVHAFGLVFFLSIVASGNLPWWATFVALATLIPFTKMIRNIFQGLFQYFGVNEEQVAGSVLSTAGSLVALSRINGKKNVNRNSFNLTGGNNNSTTNEDYSTGEVISSKLMRKVPKTPLMTAAQVAPVAGKIGKVAGTVAGTAMASSLATVNPMAGMAMMSGASTIGEKTVTTLSNTEIIGKGIAKETIRGLKEDYQSGYKLNAFTKDNVKKHLSNGVKSAAAIRNPIDTEKYPGYEGEPYSEEKPDSTRQAIQGLSRAVLSADPIAGYRKGVEDPFIWKGKDD